MPVTAPSPFVPGPLPRASAAPADAIYSGLLECPVTTRIMKNFPSAYEAVGTSSPSCPDGHGVSTASECFSAAKKCVYALAFIVVHARADWRLRRPVLLLLLLLLLLLSLSLSLSLPLSLSLSLSLSLCLSPPRTRNRLFPGQSLETTTVPSGKGSTHPVGCSALALGQSKVGVFFNNPSSEETSSACGMGATALLGSSSSLVNVSVSLAQSNDVATITLTGPSDVWFGVGFNAHEMANSPWTIVVEGEASNTTVTERHLGNHNPGSVLPASLKVVSVTIDAKSKTRTVVLSRGLKGKTSEYFTFDFDVLMKSNGALPFINAVGSQPTISYHKVRSERKSLLHEKSTTDRPIAGPRYRDVDVDPVESRGWALRVQEQERPVWLAQGLAPLRCQRVAKGRRRRRLGFVEQQLSCRAIR